VVKVGVLKVLMLRQPVGSVQGVSLRWYRPGQVYDLPAALAAYLVTEGFALVEMRADRDLPSRIDGDRRRRSAPAR
jgi:hypothetical protein